MPAITRLTIDDSGDELTLTTEPDSENTDGVVLHVQISGNATTVGLVRPEVEALSLFLDRLLIDTNEREQAPF